MNQPNPPACILVVDDDEGNRVLLERLLTTRGFRVLLAEEGHGALEMAKAPDVDLVLLDQMMPGLTGTQVLTRLRADGNDVPVIMLTAVGEASQIAEALRLGADDYVTKPFSPMVLLARAERRLRPRPPPAKPAEPSAATPPVLKPEPIDERGGFTSFFGRLVKGKRGRQPDPVDKDLPLGTVLSGRYQLKSTVGSGAFGVVYAARHVDLETDVAVKVLRGGTAALEVGVTALESFRREAVRACRVRHPNAVRVTDFGVTDDRRAYLVMELLAGESLETKIDRMRLVPAYAAGVLADVLNALAAAHAQGVIHQDVKCSNVFLHRDGLTEIAKLIDFGAAGELANGPSRIVVGTATHMAPERFESGMCDPRTDVYAAGVTLYETVTHELPHVGTTYEQLRASHLEGVFIQATHLRPELSPAWDDVFSRLMSVDPAQRPLAAEAAALVRQLR